MTERALESTDGHEDDEKGYDPDEWPADGWAPAENPRRKPRGTGQPFARGVSGNPAGRPRKRMRTGAPGDRLLGSDEPTRALILEEAYRVVKVLAEDGEAIMTANRAMIRGMTEQALKGSPTAKRRWTAMVREAELEQKRLQISVYTMMERERYLRGDEASYEDEIVAGRTAETSMVRGGVAEGEE
ncbi:MAG: DUF5681 domain-containing protein [Sphingomonas sp.]